MANQQYYGNGTPLHRAAQPMNYPGKQWPNNTPQVNGQIPQTNLYNASHGHPPNQQLPNVNSGQPPPPINYSTSQGAGDGPHSTQPNYKPPGTVYQPTTASPNRLPPTSHISQTVTAQPRMVTNSGLRGMAPQHLGNGPVYPTPVRMQQPANIPPRPSPVQTAPYNVNQHLSPEMDRLSVAQHGFNRFWGMETVDLLQNPNVLPPGKVPHPPIRLTHEYINNPNCDQDVFCCTMNKVPETNNLLQKSRLPLGIIIHPFRDLVDLSIVHTNTIVRCRSCRTYINPFVYFPDNKRWKCNICFRGNELPDEFQFDPTTKTYGDPSRRPEIRNCTIEFVAPAEYMLRPPQPAIYLFLLDVSRWACDSGYLRTLCDTLIEELDNLPGDARTLVGFILFDSALHFLSIPDGASQARELVITDIDDVFLPTPDSLLVNLQENRQVIVELLEEVPLRYRESFDDGSAMGAALQAAHKLLNPTGGRVSVFQGCLPNRGPGSLQQRDGASDNSKDSSKLGPQTDFYKRLALECSTQQIAVDLFLVAAHHADLATIAGMSQFSGGSVYQFVHYRADRTECRERLQRCLRRYLTRKIGFEAVMRVRCSRGLALHAFHGNFYVRSTDLLSLPNVNPDAGFGLQVAIEESLSELSTVCFQAALLFTSSHGERRIRVHTLCLPVTNTLSDILGSANQRAVVALISKMAVDKSLKVSVSDAREAFITVAVEILSAFKLSENQPHGSLIAPKNLALIPLYILALLKSIAFRASPVPRLDDRVYAMLMFKTLPLQELIQYIHPDLYNITNIDQIDPKQPHRLGLSSQYVDSRGVYLLDSVDIIFILVGQHVPQEQLAGILGSETAAAASKDDVITLGEDTPSALLEMVKNLQLEKPFHALIRILRSPQQWMSLLVNDKTESSFSYHELLNHIRNQVK